MPLRHIALAIVVAAVWGMNFTAIHATLEYFPPLLSVAIRFTILAIPAVLFVPRPKVAWRHLIGYGVGFGIVQFVGLYLGMAAGFPAGLASLVLQSSAPFTVLLGAVLLRERIGPRAAIGIAVAVIGLVVVGFSRGGAGSLWPFLLVVLGGLGWAFANISTRLARAPHPLHLTLWMSVVVPIPMFALSLVFEGPEQIAHSFAEAFDPAALPAWVGMAYTVLIGTVLGSGIWVWLMARHEAGVVAPFSMLVPVFGLTTAWIVLGETPGLGEILGGTLVVGGVLWASRKRTKLVPEVTDAPAILSPNRHEADTIGR